MKVLVTGVDGYIGCMLVHAHRPDYLILLREQFFLSVVAHAKSIQKMKIVKFRMAGP